MALEASDTGIYAAIMAIGAGILKVGEFVYNKVNAKDGPKEVKEPPVMLTPEQARKLDEIHTALRGLESHMRDVPNHLYRTSMSMEIMKETQAKQTEILAELSTVSRMNAENMKMVIHDIRDIRETRNHGG